MSELRLIVTAVLLIIAMALAGWVGRRQRIGAVILGLLSIVWLTVDRDWEGGVIVAVGKTHGLSTADFVGLAGLLAAGWLFVRRRG
jgi:lipopolysaccharide export LptBFGC system permease protein LptF